MALWLKFNTLWKFFRFFALIDDVEVPENMRRCVSDNFAFQEFWRDWHASFNRWIVRYMYIPLGGARRKFLVIFPIFTFVAVWHDVEIKLLAWAWLMCLFFLPELLAYAVWRSAALRAVRGRWYARHIKAAGGSANILLMMIANLVGFGVGLESVQEFLRLLFSWEGRYYTPAIFVVFFAASHIMFRQRDRERAAAERPPDSCPVAVT
eukprot:TRINITY_DN6277_c0_g1_i1.p2 TRINITY_DN6277_c0_g1~~TRINITY_DN6277_c0_g1_i1.p2  ORF type:complete len:208 (+),score=59.56 TRINITY_DN6277_c0_g1_i1:499-1122(+)